MIRLRPYKQCDAKSIVSWCKDEKTFLLWGGEHFGTFPISEDIINHKYFYDNGDCSEEDNFYPVTAFDDDGIIGHFIMRYVHGDNRILRFGWVIVDDKKRGHKYGKKMLRLGLKYAFEIMRVDKVTIGVFENNISAYQCYLSVGFRKSDDMMDSFENVQGEKWKIIELEISREEFEFAGGNTECDCGFKEDNKWFRYRAAAIIIEDGCVLFAGNEKEDYYYSIGGAVHVGETAEDAVKREVLEETGVPYEVDHIAVMHENFFNNSSGFLQGLDCHEITIYFLMKSRGTREIKSNSYTMGVRENMYWIPIKDLDKYKAFPSFMKQYLLSEHSGIEHIVTDERVC